MDVEESAVWWHAVVMARDPARGLLVYYTGSAEKAWVDAPARLRPGRLWAAGAWHPRPLPPNLPKQVLAAKAKAGTVAAVRPRPASPDWLPPVAQPVKQEPLQPQWPQQQQQQRVKQEEQQQLAAVKQESRLTAVKDEPLQEHWPQQQRQQQQQQWAAVKQEPAGGAKEEPAGSNDENDAGVVLVRRSRRERESRTTQVRGWAGAAAGGCC